MRLPARVPRPVVRRSPFSIRWVREDPKGLLSWDEAVRTGRAAAGPGTYGDPTVEAFYGPQARVTLGAYCSIAAGVRFVLGGAHRTDWVTTYPFRSMLALPGANEDGHPAPPRDIVVGSDVWIAKDAIIFDGVTIGDGAVVGASSLVTRDVRPYAIVAGSPAVERRRRFDDETVDALLVLRWWDWPADVIRERIDLLCSDRVAELLALPAVPTSPR